MKTPVLKPAFDYLAAVPRTRETSIHSTAKSTILDDLQTADSELSNLFLVRGLEGIGKTSLLNSVHYSINNKLKGEYFPIALKFNIDDGEIDKINLLRQLFDQVWESLLSKDLISLDTPEYRDWSAKLDSGSALNIDQEFPLRSGSLIASATIDPTKDAGITQGLIATDWRSLVSVARRSLPRLKNFVFIIDNLEVYKGLTLTRLLTMLTASPSNLIVAAYHRKNSTYFDEYFAAQDWKALTLDLEEPTEPEFDRLVVSELNRVSAPRKFWPTPRSFDDIYETSGHNLVDFLIIANAIWEEIRSGRLSKFEINKTVLNRSLKSIKSNSGQNTIAEIEKLAHNRDTRYEDIVDILGSKHLTLTEIIKVRNFPEILSVEKIEKELSGLQKAFDILRQSEIILPIGTDGRHKGVEDSYIESYVRCLQRDFRASRKSKSLAMSNADFTFTSLMEVTNKIKTAILRPVRQFPIHFRQELTDDSIIDEIFNSINNNSVLGIQEVLAKRQISISRDREDMAPMHFYAAEIFIEAEENSVGMTFGGICEAPRNVEEVNTAIFEWLKSNDDFREYIGAKSIRFKFAQLSEESTRDLTDISLADGEVSTGMRIFQEHDYQTSHKVFRDGANRLKSILDRYGASIPKSSRVYKNIKNAIADLDVRASFVLTLLGDVTAAVEGFEGINWRDILQDDTQWIYLDDLENALAFARNFEKALEVNNQAELFKERNIYDNFEVEKGSRYLLMYVPDRSIFDRDRPEMSDKCRYEAGSVHDRKVPKLRAIFYENQLGKLSNDEATNRIAQILGDYREIDSPPIIRLYLWILYRLENNEKIIRDMITDIESMVFEPSEEAEDLYDDLSTIKRLLR